jgi:hypothetical protein
MRQLKNGQTIWQMRANKRQNLRAAYFTDEASDSTLFSARGKVLLGSDGCSRYFILGTGWVYVPSALRTDLASLRRELLADPYFAKVPSMQPENNKTAVLFHAKDDLPEVRREVFRVLREHPMECFAVVKDKYSVLASVRTRNIVEPTYRYHNNELYDSLVTKLFEGRLHKDGAYDLHFARRGTSDRTAALQTALQRSQERFEQKWGIVGSAPISVVPCLPRDEACLQAVDYFLWALQRCFERNDDRYISYVWPSVRLVHDLDDVRERGYGEYYTSDKALETSVLHGRRRRFEEMLADIGSGRPEHTA